MKREMMDILACPMCKGALELRPTEESKLEVVSGSLFCAPCKEEYPIEDTIPNLLPPDLR